MHPNVDSMEHKQGWGLQFRVPVGMLTYLQASTRPEKSIAVHQCACFNKLPDKITKRGLSSTFQARKIVGFLQDRKVQWN